MVVVPGSASGVGEITGGVERMPRPAARADKVCAGPTLSGTSSSGSSRRRGLDMTASFSNRRKWRRRGQAGRTSGPGDNSENAVRSRKMRSNSGMRGWKFRER